MSFDDLFGVEVKRLNNTNTAFSNTTLIDLENFLNNGHIKLELEDGDVVTFWLIEGIEVYQYKGDLRIIKKVEVGLSGIEIVYNPVHKIENVIRMFRIFMCS